MSKDSHRSENKIAQNQKKYCSPSEFKNSKDHKQKENLYTKLIDSEKEVIKLNNLIEKISEKERRNLLYYELNLQNISLSRKNLMLTNKDYKKRIQILEGQNEKLTKLNDLAQYKVSKNQMLNSHNSMISNKENINIENIYQTEQCIHKNCLNVKKQLNSLKIIGQQILNNIETLICDIQIKHQKQWSCKIVTQWKREFINERKKLTSLESKNQITILQRVQQKINRLSASLAMSSLKQNHQQYISTQLINIKSKHKTLSNIPFLQKIDLQARRDQCQIILQQSLQRKDKIIRQLIK